MILKKFVELPLENNNYLLIDETSKEAALIDASHYDEKILEELKLHNAKLKYILLTHAHFDHILGVEKLAKATGAKVVLHPDDKKLLKDLNTYTYMVGMPSADIPHIDIFINDGEDIKLGETIIRTIHTPGHTQGGCSYLFENKLFSGDTLFKESIGRTDLAGGSFQTLEKSIKDKLYVLPDNTIVYPGHGPETNIGHEKKYNSYI